MYARGGPSSVDKDKSLRALLDRSPADVRGIKLQQERAAAGDPPLTARPSQSPGEAGVLAARVSPQLLHDSAAPFQSMKKPFVMPASLRL